MSDTRTIFGHIRTFIIVTLITIMVWLLAESRMVRNRTIEAQIVLTTVPVPVTATGNETVLVVRQSLEQVQVRTAEIKIEGSTAGLDRFARTLQNRVELRVGREIPGKPGTHTIDLRAILRQISESTGHGLIISEVSPATINVQVDELQSREFPVRVVLPNEIQLDGAPRADPDLITVTAPTSILNGIRSNEAVVRIDDAEISQLAQGRLETIPGVVVQIDGVDRQDWATQITPSQVDVFVTLRTLTENHTIDRLPIQVLLAPGEIGKWLVRINESDKDLVNVEISGSAQAIEMLKSGEIEPRAFINLSFEELERGISSKPAQILGLPAGCRVTSPQMTVKFDISAISSTADIRAEPE
ncbi:MAG: hypothetical protein P1U42_00905 [Phycisphaerales bacterium]|nr:hypothetical protein [Phycisphaerales bacterium]